MPTDAFIWKSFLFVCEALSEAILAQFSLFKVAHFLSSHKESKSKEIAQRMNLNLFCATLEGTLNSKTTLDICVGGGREVRKNTYE